MSYKSFGEKFGQELVADKKKAEKARELSTQRLQKKREEALKKFKETKDQTYADQVTLLDRILDHSDAKAKGIIGQNKVAA